MFESIKHIDELGNEYWNARELIRILNYSNWQNFEKIIDKAKTSCQNSDISVFEHFTDVNKTIKMPKGAEKTIDDYQYVVEELAEGEEIDFDGRKAIILTPDKYKLKKVEPAKENFKIMTVRGSIREKNSSGRFYVKYLEPLVGKYPDKTIGLFKGNKLNKFVVNKSISKINDSYRVKNKKLLIVNNLLN